MTDDLRTRVAKVLARLYEPKCCEECDILRDIFAVAGYLEDADAVIRELPELNYAHVQQRIMLSHASQAAERRRLDAASWLEKELAAAGLKCGAGWVLYNLVDGVVARLNGVAE